MPSVLVMLNNQLLVHAGTAVCTSLSWHLCCSRHEGAFGKLLVQGMITRPDGLYDHPEWLVAYPLKTGDSLQFSCMPSLGSSAISRLQTHEELEEQRQEVARAEAAGEYDAARAAPKTIVRDSCTIELQSTSGVRTVEARNEITEAIWSGVWSSDIRPTEWRLRLWVLPSSPAISGFWESISGGAHVDLRA